MITAIIIDDEQHCINNLERQLTEHCSNTVDLRGSFQNVEEGIQAIIQLQPELVFLDVEIKGQTAFDLLKQLPGNDSEIIFTTAHDKYAVQAFKFSAIDYLLKPVRTDDLIKAVSKLKDKLSKTDMSARLDALISNLKIINGAAKKICIPVQTGLMFLQVNDIIRCEGNSNYTDIFTSDKKKHTIPKTLGDFEELLNDYGFFRVHYSHLINLNNIKNYNKGKGGFITMDDGSHVEVSTRRKEEFLKRLSGL